MGKDFAPTISQTRPSLPARKKDSNTPSLPLVVIEVEDNDIINFITGGLHGVKAYVSGKVKILGDLQLALDLEQVFFKTGGVEKVMTFLKNHNLS